MTRYLCADPSHSPGADPASIDVTAQVRSERGLPPRESAYLAETGDVVRRVRELADDDPDVRAADVRRILTGTNVPLDVPVVLMAGDRVPRAPGLYEIDELRRSDRSVATLLDRYAQPGSSREGSEDVVVLREEIGTIRPDGTLVQPVTTADAVTVEQTQRIETATVLPQGVFPVLELASRLAAAGQDEAAIVEAVHDTPSTGSAPQPTTQPWRVMVECPVPTGEPPARHHVVFSGDGSVEPVDVLGVPAAGSETALNTASQPDAILPFPARRAERRLVIAIAGVLAVGAVLLVLTWISGALAFAARETPVWLGLSITLAVAAVTIGLVAMVSRSQALGNSNDTLELRRHYDSRIDMLWYATVAMGVVFAVALAVGIVPPILSSETPVPAAAITFNASERIVTATVAVQTQGVPTDEPVSIQIRQYPSETSDGVLIGLITTTGDPSGGSTISETVSLDRGARYMSVVITVGDATPAVCTPTVARGAGCTVVSVPPLGAGVVRLVPTTSALDVVIEPTPTIAPTVAPSVVPTVTVAPSVTPTTVITPSPTT
ncbi:MAG TPA: hypothetical protein VI341_01360 [Actinomycetota bacterium]